MARTLSPCNLHLILPMHILNKRAITELVPTIISKAGMALNNETLLLLYKLHTELCTFFVTLIHGYGLSNLLFSSGTTIMERLMRVFVMFLHVVNC